MSPFPNTPDDLITELARLYPEYVPSPADDMATIQYKAGQRSVVAYLKQWRANPQQDTPRVVRGQGRPTR